MSIKVKCEICGAVCGVRQPITFRLMRGAKVDIVAKCRSCNEVELDAERDFNSGMGKEYKPDPNFDINDLLSQFGMKK